MAFPWAGLASDAAQLSPPPAAGAPGTPPAAGVPGTLSTLIQPESTASVVGPRDEAELTTRLASRGILGIRNLRREGSVYRAEALWHGEVVDLHVDAESGEVKHPERLNAKQVTVLLQAQGWERVGDVKRGGDTFTVRAQRGPHAYDLKIDARTGEVREVR